MTRLVPVATMLLAALARASPNKCSGLPKALLQDFEEAEQWCSSHKDRNVPCSVFADLQEAALALASDLWYVLFPLLSALTNAVADTPA